ncbi:uncharacterized protein LOC5511726 isoform X2 [Nematostella vectensis]|uniref:uncharacterized protein LOC5511726 isoform X2 n=1 Tax=Nematostella vectensis TaxID=45351 RepID=UPI002077167B|nr:uncharacterized protein LOC5511726 isoform X2 [Nematostella vectensis]
MGEWEYRELTTNEDGKRVEQIRTKRYKDEIFKAESRLIDYGDGIPMGKYVYPFYCTLGPGLPGSFKSKGVQASNDKWQAEILYSVTAEVEMAGVEAVLKASQYITVCESLPMTQVEQEQINMSRKVKFCCCIPRGDVLLGAWLDKKAFVAGELAQLHLDVKNNSSIDIESFGIKMVRVVNLKPKQESLSGSHDEKSQAMKMPAFRMPCISNDVIRLTNPGCISKDKKESVVTLELEDKETNEAFQPTTKGQLIQCRYYIDANVDIPYAEPILVQIPVTVQAPKNKMWHNWEPPQWVDSCQLVKISGSCAVPESVLGSKVFASIPGFQADPFG